MPWDSDMREAKEILRKIKRGPKTIALQKA
jgi:hypothetical protein